MAFSWISFIKPRLSVGRSMRIALPSLLRWIRENAAAAAGFNGRRGFSRAERGGEERGRGRGRGKEEEENWRKGSIRMEMERALCALRGFMGCRVCRFDGVEPVNRKRWKEAGQRWDSFAHVKTRSYARVFRGKGFARHFRPQAFVNYNHRET